MVYCAHTRAVLLSCFAQNALSTLASRPFFTPSHFSPQLAPLAAVAPLSTILLTLALTRPIDSPPDPSRPQAGPVFFVLLDPLNVFTRAPPLYCSSVDANISSSLCVPHRIRSFGPGTAARPAKSVDVLYRKVDAARYSIASTVKATLISHPPPIASQDGFI
jgi:hypothetical protein